MMQKNRPKASLSLLSVQHHFNFWPHVKTTILNFGILWVFEFYVCVCVGHAVEPAKFFSLPKQFSDVAIRVALRLILVRNKRKTFHTSE